MNRLPSSSNGFQLTFLPTPHTPRALETAHAPYGSGAEPTTAEPRN